MGVVVCCIWTPTAKTVSVAAEDCNKAITFELGEGVGAGFGIDEVFANPFKVGYVDRYCFAFANVLVLGGAEEVIG